MKFSWVTVMVNNMDESLAFYTEIVGLKFNRRLNAEAGVELAFLGEGETKVELICNQAIEKVSIGEDISLGFQVNNLDETMKMFQEKGIALHSGPFQPNPHLKFFYIVDPNGLKIQFIEVLLKQ